MTTIGRAQHFEAMESRRHYLVASRLRRRALRRAMQCVVGIGDRWSSDWHDESFEVYGCDHGDRLTPRQVRRLFDIGYRTVYVNSDRQEVAYSQHRGLEARVRTTTRDAHRKCYPDTIVLYKEKYMTLAECEALKATGA
jgi:hypothetical protein